MKIPTISPTAVRFLAFIVLAVFVAIAGVTFYNMASIPTDENVFATTPSRILFTQPLSGRIDGSPKAGLGASGVAGPEDARGILAGDLLVMVNDRPVRKNADLNRELAAGNPDSVRVRVYRPWLTTYFTFQIARGELKQTAKTEMAASVVITSVVPGGASDRAGMRVGDIVSRINGVGFTDAQDADAELRRAKSGSTSIYEGLRGTDPLALHVTLARFGFPLSQLIFSLTGIAFMVFGAFLLLKRADLVSARAIGTNFLLIGFVIAILLIKREPDPTLFVQARTFLQILAIFFGTAAGMHGAMVFPVSRLSVAHRRWIFPGIYTLALLSPLVILLREEAFMWMAYFIYLLVASILTMANKTPLQAEQKRVTRPVRKAMLVVHLAVIVFTIGLALIGLRGIIGYVGIVLLGFPLSYLFVITRYQLIDIDFRVRRNVQYTALSWAWGILVAILFIRLLIAVPGLPIQVPGITVTGFSVEINPVPANASEQIFLERLVMLLAGALMWFGLWYVRKWGQEFIDRKYYRTQFDHRRAAASLAEVLSSRLSMNDIARGIVDTLIDLMRIRAAGLMIVRNGATCWSDASAGIAPEIWQGVVRESGQALAAAVGEHAGPVRVGILPPSVAGALGRAGIQCAVPIHSHSRLVGILLIGEKLADTSLGEDDLAFLSGVAKQIAVSIDNAFLYEEHAEKERMRHELDIARRIQLSSLPSVTPDVPGLDIAGMSIPALEVGGDFFDYLGWDGKDLMVVVGDVSGKGTSAALYMSKVQGILRSLYGFDLPPREGFIRANKLLCSDLEKTSFVTALGARYQAATRRLTLLRAGHLPLYHYHAATGVVERVTPRGLGLGLNDAGVFSRELEDRDVRFEAGDVMLFVTDGVTEARSPAGEEYGDDRICAVVADHASSPAQAIRDALAEDVRRFGAGLEQHDDQTIVVVKAV